MQWRCPSRQKGSKGLLERPSQHHRRCSHSRFQSQTRHDRLGWGRRPMHRSSQSYLCSPPWSRKPLRRWTSKCLLHEIPNHPLHLQCHRRANRCRHRACRHRPQPWIPPSSLGKRAFGSNCPRDSSTSKDHRTPHLHRVCCCRRGRWRACGRQCCPDQVQTKKVSWTFHGTAFRRLSPRPGANAEAQDDRCSHRHQRATLCESLARRLVGPLGAQHAADTLSSPLR